MTVLPPEIKFGRVVARWLLAAADTVADPDENPDAVVPTGKVTFTRINSSASLYDSLQNDGTYVGIVTKPVEAVLNAQGELSLAHNPTNGIWLVTGGYKVTFAVDGVTWPDFEIEVTEAHTLVSPLDLILTTPIESTPTQVVVASLETALRAEAAADRAEAAAQAAAEAPGWSGGSLSGEGQPAGSAPTGTVYVDTLATAGAQVWVYTGTTWEVLIGDTGWRQLGALAVPPFDKDWTSLMLRRIGAQVYLKEAATYMLNNGATQLNNPIRVLTLPSAFRGGENIHLKTGVSGITFQIGGDGWFSGVVPSNMTLLKADLSIITWPASQPWPATLPGEAV